jgi:hypothetical protein
VLAEYAAIAQLAIERRSRQTVEKLQEQVERTGRNDQAAIRACR